MPTPTIREAPDASASSSATSSVVPELESGWGGRRAARAGPRRTGARPGRSTRTTSSGARSALSDFAWPAGARCRALSPTTTTSGGGPPRAARRRPASTPISTGRCSRMKRRSRAGPRVVVAADHHDDRAALDPGAQVRDALPCSSRSCSRRRNSVVLWVKLSSWASSRRGPAPSRRRRCRSSSRPTPPARPATNTALVDPDRLPSGAAEAPRRRRCRPGPPRPRPAARGRGWGSDRR